MGEYGLQTYDSEGNTIIDVSSRLNRHRYANEVSASSSSSTVLSDISGLNTIELSIAINPSDLRKAAHQITRSDTTISWTAQTHADNQCDSLLLVFFYV